MAVGLRGDDSGRVTGTRPTDRQISWSAAGRSLRCAGRGVLDEAGTEPAGAGGHAGRRVPGGGAAGAPWSCSNRTPPRLVLLPTSGGGAQIPPAGRGAHCSWNRSCSRPGRCAPTRRRCARLVAAVAASGRLALDPSGPIPCLRRGHTRRQVRPNGRFTRNQPVAGGSARSVPSRTRRGRARGRPDGRDISAPPLLPRAGRHDADEGAGAPTGGARPPRRRSLQAPTRRPD